VFRGWFSTGAGKKFVLFQDTIIKGNMASKGEIKGAGGASSDKVENLKREIRSAGE
jgi:hypothetical protein